MKQESLFSFIHSRVQNYHDAEDILQEVLIKVWRFDLHEDKVILRTAQNTIIDFYRANARRHTIQLYEIGDVRVDPIAEWEQREIVRELLARIDPKYRSVLLLRAHDWKFREIAQALSISLNEVTGRYKTALAQLAYKV